MESVYTIVRSPKNLLQVERAILPGVGSFMKASVELKENKLLSALRSFARDGNPLMGICLGMQLLSERGMEGGVSEGLGLIGGTTQPLPKAPGIQSQHVGWNSIKLKSSHPTTNGILDETDFYFVHGFTVANGNAAEILSVTNHGEDFVSAVSSRNVVGFQFHPEKSQKPGQKIFENFLAWDGKC